jgi:hypothetical protein
LQQFFDSREDLFVLKEPSRRYIVTASLHGGKNVFLIGEKVFHALLQEFIGTALGLGGQVLKSLFQRGSEVDSHVETIEVHWLTVNPNFRLHKVLAFAERCNIGFAQSKHSPLAMFTPLTRLSAKRLCQYASIPRGSSVSKE